MILLPVRDVRIGAYFQIFQVREAVKVERAFRCGSNLDRGGLIDSDRVPESVVPPSGKPFKPQELNQVIPNVP